MVRAAEAGVPARANSLPAPFCDPKARGAGRVGYVELAQITALTGLSNKDGDSLHRLVMDLHKALNRLAATHAEECRGAHAYGLLPETGRGRGLHARRRGAGSLNSIIRGWQRRPCGRANGSRSRTTSEKPMPMWS